MSRPLRIEYEGAFYHIIARGQRKEKIFYSDNDKKTFLRKLNETLIKYSIKLYCYCLMNNHYHLLIETQNANLSHAMHYFNASYSNYLKAKHSIVGSIFQGRYKSILVQRDEYFLNLSLYIHLNPVRAGIVEKAEDYKWSSIKYFIEKEERQTLLTLDLNISKLNKGEYNKYLFKWEQKNQKIERKTIYGKNSILGNEEFVNKIKVKVKDLLEYKDRDIEEFSEAKKILKIEKKDIENLIIREFNVKKDILYLQERGNIYRLLYIYGLKMYTSMTVKRIAETMNLNYKSIYSLINYFLKKCKTTTEILNIKERFDRKI